MLKKRKGATGVNLGKHWKIIDSFCSPRPRKPLNHLKKLSPSPKTIEVFGKPPPVPLPFSGGGDREGDPFVQCPLPSSLKYFHVLHTFWSKVCVHDVCRYNQINLYSFAVEMRCIPSTKVHILCTLDYIRCRKVHYNSYKICAIVYMMLLVSYMEYGVLSLSLTGFILPAIWNCLHIFDVHYMDFEVSPISLDLAPGVCSFLHTL